MKYFDFALDIISIIFNMCYYYLFDVLYAYAEISDITGIAQDKKRMTLTKGADSGKIKSTGYTKPKINADEVLKSSDKGDYEQGQLLAYATVLGIIRDELSGYDLKEYGLDFDIDKKYLLG